MATLPRSPGTVAAALTALGLTAGLAIGPAVLDPHAAEPAGATTAQAADDPVAAAAAALRSDPVFVDPAAEQALDDGEAADLRDAIRAAGTPVFVAVLPASAGEAEDVVRRLVADVGLSGTYAGIVGDTFRATSTQLGSADEIASAAFQAERDAGPAAVLERFVDDLGSSAAGGGTGGTGGSGAFDDGRRTSDDDGGGSSLLPAGLLVAGGAGALVWSRRRRNQRVTEQRSRLAGQTQMVRAELSVVADDVLRLEPEVELHPDARNDYEAAVERHRIASAALDYADEAVDLVRVQRVVDEARYAMARARAIVRGHEPPPPPDELRRPGRHQEPPLDIDEQGVPVYAGGQPFHGSGGWFGGGAVGAGAGLFGGLLLGSMLGGPFGWGGGWGGGWGWGGPVIMGGGWGDGGDGGDGGGDGGGWGDGGGFDMGGGDWGGGGDMGGGDF